MITQELVKEYFDYKDGHLIRLKSVGGKQAFKGRVAGYQNKDSGYSYASIKCKEYGLHRLIFLWHHGYLPNMVDHKDNNPRNNKIENLRAVDKSKNAMNSKLGSDNTSGAKGVYWNKKNKNWNVRITANNIYMTIGTYSDFNEAVKAINKARAKYHGEFARNY